MTANKREPDFVVTDRRKFTDEGDLRPEATPSQTESETSSQKNDSAHVAAEKFTAQEARGAAPPPPTEAEQKAQHAEYQAGSKRLDDLINQKTGGKSQNVEMNFERLVASLYMTAMFQIGMMAPEGEQPQVDIVGARQTVDTLGVLQEKTKGNLTPAEQTLLQQSLFDLRMAFLELTNAISQQAPSAGARGEPKQ